MLTGVGRLHPDFVTTVIFTSTFIGVTFARSLHYQFYCWYFHMLPYLLHRVSDRIPIAAKLAILAAIEVCFNVYPSTAWSSALLQVRLSNAHHAGCMQQLNLTCDVPVMLFPPRSATRSSSWGCILLPHRAQSTVRQSAGNTRNRRRSAKPSSAQLATYT